ncbi:MAG: penicillin-binding protein 1A [Gammaproteobacteria bacterium]|nr:penicillin-binding protein 1A [Gammaproteobacteria bacterium]
MTPELRPDPPLSGPGVLRPEARPPRPRPRRSWWWLLVSIVLGLSAAGAGAAGVALFWLYRQLPPTDVIKELKLSVPMRVFTRDGKLIGEFGAERRDPLRYDQFPAQAIQAFLAAEDDRFFEHPGVDWHGLARAAAHLVATGEKSQGGSTITMQLARNVFLSSERTYTRKAKEILLALRIEKDLDKRQILEIYLNKIFLGQRAYGVGAAAQVYFGKELRELSLGEVAILAGLPKAPSRDNPVASPERARDRRNYVLRRMRELGYVEREPFEAALKEPVLAREERPAAEVDAYYVAEMVRTELVNRYGEAAYGDGYTVTTTLDAQLQRAANESLRAALRDYDLRHGWRGPEARLPPEALAEFRLKAAEPHPLADAALDALPAVAELLPAAVVEFAPERLRVLTRDHSLLDIRKDEFAWAGFTDELSPAPGDLVRVRRQGERWALAQLPAVQGAFVALDPRDGAIRALVGGYDYFHGKFNRVIQARRQPGSGFKPFLYSAALAAGFTPASVILDAPVVFDDPALESTWRPENYSGKFYGPTRLREALVESRNLVSIRLLQSIGVEYARDYAAKFGLPAERIPRDLTLALGSGAFTPLEIARGYAVFANGGFLVEPHFIAEIRNSAGEVAFKAEPAPACPECPEPEPEAPAAAVADMPPAEGAPRTAPRAIEPRIVYLARDMLRDVVTSGTAARVRELGRGDLAGKTGTTNDETDAWFNGFSSHLVAVCWLGFDQPTPLGRGEVGGRAALPMWMDFMQAALKGVPEEWPERPPGLVSVRINPQTGKLASATAQDAMFEVVQAEHLPPADSEEAADGQALQQKPEDLY